MSRKNISIGKLMEEAFDKVLPIPKTPRIYRQDYWTPRKALTWVPHGKLGNWRYEERLMDFASEIRVIDAQRSRRVKYSSRGWCYLLEGLGKIHKGEFNACQRAINDCRKTGLLPIDFVAEDQDITRRFSGIHEASNPSVLLEKVKGEVEGMLNGLPASTTDYWAGEEYYVMMCVEKGDILNLFKPICDEYHVPIVNSKGWPPILLRSHIATLSSRAEANGLTPVLLLFYDHDPAGIKISNRFRKMLSDCEGGTGWSPSNLIINRFGLNKEDIDKHDLMWIENVRTGSGRESRDWRYIREYGRRKCESNALFKNDETLTVGEEICRRAIEKYYGDDALDRFKEKEELSRKGLKHVYDSEIWEDFYEAVNDIIATFAKGREEKQQKPLAEAEAKEEIEVLVDIKKIFHRCPKCDRWFQYDRQDIGRLLKCRHCMASMRLKAKEES